MFTQTSIHLLARLLAGAPADEVDLTRLNGLRDIALAVITAEDRLNAFEAAIVERRNAKEIRQVILAVDPSLPPPRKMEPVDM